MCGISLFRKDNQLDINNIKEYLDRRGPDISSEVILTDWLLYGSVLNIQGEITKQPIVNNDLKTYLCWNGEIFGGLDIPKNTCDTLIIFNILNDIVTKYLLLENESINYDIIDKAISEFVETIWGPYSFIYVSETLNCIYYGRDPFGRRSLIGLSDDNNYLHGLSSTLYSNNNINYKCNEINTSGIYRISLDITNQSPPILIPWSSNRIKLQRHSIESNIFNNDEVSIHSSIFLNKLTNAISRRLNALSINNMNGYSNSVGVLFSGGIDSVLIAAVFHLCLSNESQSIDLINVSFVSPEDKSPSPDRLAAIGALHELQTIYPNRKWNLVNVDIDAKTRNDQENHIKNLISPLNTHMDLNIGTAFYFASKGCGYLSSYESCNINNFTDNGRPLLRFGDNDTALALGRSIESLNNSNKSINRTIKIKCIKENCNKYSKENCSSNLCKSCCLQLQRQQELITSCKVHKLKTIEKKSVDNESYSYIDIDDEKIPYISNCRVLLVGIGADEQMAGYGRHRTTFLKHGLTSLENELNQDLQRLWTRNLGRDDRCISDNGKEAWFPYLDEELVIYLQSLQLTDICDLNQEQGCGDKKILRDAAKLIGLSNSTKLVKRAIQFGTRIAKNTNKLYHGSNRKGRGDSKIRDTFIDNEND